MKTLRHNCKDITRRQHDAIQGNMQDAHDMLCDKFDTFGLSEELEKINFESGNGFIAFTEGGIFGAITADIAQVVEDGNAPKALVKILKDKEREFDADYMKDNPKYSASTDGDAYEDAKQGQLGVVLFLIKAQYYDADNTRGGFVGKGSVLFEAAYNFDEYGRDEYAVPLITIETPLDALTADSIADTFNKLAEALGVKV
ncbi:MAG: hypothetical protein R8K20_09265 [Gallionellaceae bacterium]